MASGVFGVAISGLNAAQAGLVTTGHNIANANTPGYHRQSITQSAAPPAFTGAGFLGQGVNVDTVVRSYNQFLESQIVSSEARASYFSAFAAQLGQIDNLLADADAGLSPSMQEFFSAVHDVAAHPASAPSRQALLSRAESLVARFRTMDARFTELGDAANRQVVAAISGINAYASEIANLNERIVMAQNAAGQPPNDLLDRRDHLVTELGKLAGATVVHPGNGMINVAIGSGQNLVVGSQWVALSATAGLDDPTRIDVGYQQGGSVVPIAPASLQTGTLGALLNFRDRSLVEAQNMLGLVATGLVHTFNAQHRLGQDLDGLIGGDFFSVPSPLVTPRTSNTGNGVVQATLADPAALAASSYRLTYTGANYQLTRLADNTVTTYATLPQTVDGINLALASGTPVAGDSFLVEPVRYAARNIGVVLTGISQIAAAAPIRTATGSQNTGAAVISAGEVNAPPPVNANLQQPVTITFTGAGTFNVSGTGTGNPVGVVYASGTAISYNGWTVRISGIPAAGDTFTVGSNTGGVSDSRNMALLAGLQTANTLANGTATYQGAYGQLVSRMGEQTRQSGIAASAQETLRAHTRESQQSLSGVNLDEEAANLIRYQQAYQASSKVIEVASRLFETLLGVGAR